MAGIVVRASSLLDRIHVNGYGNALCRGGYWMLFAQNVLNTWSKHDTTK